MVKEIPLLLIVVFTILAISGCNASNSTVSQSNKGSIRSQYYKTFKQVLYEKVGPGYSKYFYEKYDTVFIGFSDSETSIRVINEFIDGMVKLEGPDKQKTAKGILLLFVCKQTIACDKVLASNNMTEADLGKMVGF